MKSPVRSQVTVVLNRESGTMVRADPDVVEADLRKILEELGCTAEIHCVPGKGIDKALHAALAGDADAVFVGGGDGTVASAAHLFQGSDKPIGILPLGTLNLAARDVGMPLDWREAVKLLVDAPVGHMDLLDVDGRTYLSMLILGSYPSLMMSRPEYHGSWVGKTFRSFWNAFASAAKFPPFSLRLNDGEKVHLHRTRLALLANNDYEDIFGVIPQRQSLDAGFFTVYVSKHRSLFGMAKSAGSWILGRWKQDREISKMRATELEIDVKKTRELAVMIDGELEKVPSPFRVKLLPKALKVIAPRLAVEAGKAEQDAAAV